MKIIATEIAPKERHITLTIRDIPESFAEQLRSLCGSIGGPSDKSVRGLFDEIASALDKLHVQHVTGKHFVIWNNAVYFKNVTKD